MKILAIDPGTVCTGYAIIERHERAITLHDAGAISLKSHDPIPTRLGTIHERIGALISQWHIQALALETPFLGKNPQNFLKLGYVRGVLYLLSHQHQLALIEFAPREIKALVTGFGSADKIQVQRALSLFFPGLQARGPADITDAIAIGLAAVLRSQQSQLIKF